MKYTIKNLKADFPNRVYCHLISSTQKNKLFMVQLTTAQRSLVLSFLVQLSLMLVYCETSRLGDILD